MTWLAVLVALGALFNFLTGVRDSSSIVATMISSRSLGPRLALSITALAEFAGPFLFGVAVANTVARDVAHPSAINMAVLLSALLAANAWNLFTWWLGVPSSSSHALFGGLLGAALMNAGPWAANQAGLVKIGAALFFSPVIGLLAGYLFTRLVFFLARHASPHVNWIFKRAQIITAALLALSHGANDGPKIMGVIVLGLVITGRQTGMTIPLWVIALCSTAIALGTSMGGWRLIRTLGAKFYRIRPVDGFCSQVGSAAVVLGASLLGAPVSTTQVVSSAILGVGAAERMNKVRWTAAIEIAIAWLVTIPVSGLLAAGIFVLLRLAPGLH